MRSRWDDGLEQKTKVLVEHIAVKYDAAWRAGWLTEEALWKNPYCEGMIEALGYMADETDENGIRRAVAGYCASHGYMPMPKERPGWLADEIVSWKERWALEEDARLSTRTGVVESRRKLQKSLRDKGWLVFAGPKATKQWMLKRGDMKVDDKDITVYIEVRAHQDGGEASYTVCNSNWLPIL